MRSSQIHPRLLARISKVRENRQGEVLDTQVRVYSRLCKAVKQLRKSRHPAGPDATAVCARSAQAIRQLALKDRLGDEHTLGKIYGDLDRVSTAICAALGVAPLVEQDPPADRQELTGSSNPVRPGIPGHTHAQIPGDETEIAGRNHDNPGKEPDRILGQMRSL